MQDLVKNVIEEFRDLWKKLKNLPPDLQSSIALFGAMLCVVLLSYAFILSQIINSWRRPEYEFGALIPVLAGIVLWSYRQPILASSHQEKLLGISVILLCSAIRYYSWVVTGRQQPLYYSLIGCLGGLILILGGWRMIAWTWPGLLLLTLAMPFSAKMERETFTRLQTLSTKSSVFALETLGIDVESIGNEIKLRQGSEEINLNVAEACAGFKGMLTAISVTLTVVFLIRAELWIKILLVCSALPIAMFANVLRIVLQCVSYQVSTGFAGVFHDYLAGLIVYPVVFGLLYLEYYLLRNLVLDDSGELFKPLDPAPGSRMKLPAPLSLNRPPR